MLREAWRGGAGPRGELLTLTIGAARAPVFVALRDALAAATRLNAVGPLAAARLHAKPARALLHARAAKADTRACASRALVQALRVAFDAGFEDYKKVRSDPNLAGVRSGPDFDKVMDMYDEPIINGSAIRALKKLFS